MDFISLIEKIHTYWKNRIKCLNTYNIDKISEFDNLFIPSDEGSNEDTLITKAVKPLEFAGERFLLDERSRIRLQHMHRYAVVQGLVQDKKILDIGCGDGYGSALLAKTAQSVVGVAIAQEVVNHAQNLNRASNLKFVQGSATQLEFADASFDVVVWLEAIEHLEEQMLRELSRVLRSDGILIISSPNRPIYSEESGELNEFHVRELGFQEFDDLLGQQFKSIRYYGQRIQMGSMINPIAEARCSLAVWSDSGQEISQKFFSVKESIYLVAICSKNKLVTLPNIEASVMYPEAIDLVKYYIGFASWEKNQDHQIIELQKLLSEEIQKNIYKEETYKNRHQELSDIRQQLIRAQEQLAARDQELIRVQEQLAARDQELIRAKEHVAAFLLKYHESASSSEALKIEQHSHNSAIIEIQKTLLTLKKTLDDSQHCIYRSNQEILHLKSYVEILNISYVQKIKRKLRSLIKKDAVIIERIQNTPLIQYPWLVLFDASWYLQKNPDVAEAGMNPLEHYVQFGISEGRSPNAYFDSNWYLDHNQDVRISGMDPLEHYWLYGWKDGRNPSKSFDAQRYLFANIDVQNSGMNPLEHYLLYGRAEGRAIIQDFDRLDEFKQECAKEIQNYLTPYTSFFNTIQSDEGFLAKVLSEIRFKECEEPLVSIIIPIYGKWEYTLQCLYSLFINLPTHFGVEVLVVDDRSKDNSFSLLQKIEGIKLLRNDTNQGFIKSCNAGAMVANGQYVCFLNNDTVVFPMWLEELVKTFDNLPNTGLVGSKLIYPDGSLQEAGGIIWKDGSAWNFGNKQDISLPEFNYAREVDYCSGASIILPRDLFRELGGFDEHYLPLYCEDSDIALKVRHMGMRVIYQPLSKLIHFEGATSGTDPSQGMKAYQVANTQKLFDRWKDLLYTHQSNGEDVDGAKDRTAKYRVLVLELLTPTPAKDAGSVSIVNMLILLREAGFQVTYIPTDNFYYAIQEVQALQRIGVEVLYAPYTTSLKEHVISHGTRYDLVFFMRPQVITKHFEVIQKYCPQAKTLYYPHDIHYLRMEREALLNGDAEKGAQAKVMKVDELKGISRVDLSIMVSEEELKVIQKELHSVNLTPLSLLLDIPGTKASYDERSGIVFVGSFNHTPNVDAALYLVKEVMPLVREKGLDIHLYIAGSNPTSAIEKLEAPDITVLGFVQDLNGLYDSVRVSIAPLRYGAGVKGKVGTAMAAGLPVVVTPVAFEGMGIIDGEDVLVGSTAQELADAIARVYEDRSLWNSLSKSGIKRAEANWGSRAAWNNFKFALEKLDFVISDPNTIDLYKT